MEQAARCWMLTKRKHSLTSSNSSSYDHHDSWEEQAFAEDAAGPLGGCIWPPRSYSCSFCRREFRSAQALGGHMNVHRRDRARLKQSPPLLDHHHQNHDHHQNHLFQTPNLGFQYPNSSHNNQICTLVYSPNPNSDPPPPSRSSPSKSSVKPPNFDPKELFPSFSSPTKKDKEAPLSDRYFNNMVSDPVSDTQKKQSGILESGCRTHDVEEEEEEDGVGGFKRRRISTSSSSLPFFVKSNSSVDRQRVPVEFFEIGPCSIEELDLELRLGDRPKIVIKRVAVAEKCTWG